MFLVLSSALVFIPTLSGLALLFIAFPPWFIWWLTSAIYQICSPLQHQLLCHQIKGFCHNSISLVWRLTINHSHCLPHFLATDDWRFTFQDVLSAITIGKVLFQAYLLFTYLFYKVVLRLCLRHRKQKKTPKTILKLNHFKPVAWNWDLSGIREDLRCHGPYAAIKLLMIELWMDFPLVYHRIWQWCHPVKLNMALVIICKLTFEPRKSK